MRNVKKLSETPHPIKIVLFGSAVVTLSIWTNFADPFNPVKLSLILFMASWLAGYLIIDRKKILHTHEMRHPLLLIIMFLLSLLIATLNSSVRLIAWIGDYQRLNGFLFYASMCIIAISVGLYFKESDLQLFLRVILILGFIISVYGLFQINGLDFVKWDNPYNAIIVTVGNPNFAGAILASIGVLSLGGVFWSFSFSIRSILSIVLFCIILITIILSEARQGLIGLGLGSTFIIGIWLHSKKILVGRLYFLTMSLIGFFAVLGMLQIGPLSKLLYKGSVTVRGYYWRAGIEMFKDNPWFGVGVDNYAGYFRQYKELGYVLNYGYDITSSNAHNVFIQIFSTAGILTGSAYLIFTLYVFWRGVLGIRKSHIEKRIYIATIFGAWLTLLSISIISIDSPGVTVWFWVLSGIILALTPIAQIHDNSIKKSEPLQLKVRNKSKQTLLSSALLIPILFLSINIFRVESAVLFARKVFNPNSLENSNLLQTHILNVARNPFIHPMQMTELASYLGRSGYGKDAIELLNSSISKDPRNYDAINLLANYYSELKNPEMAIKLRLQITELDPYNSKNYYQLGIIYKERGDYKNMEKMKKIILSIAKDTAEGDAALKDLVT